MMFSYQPQGGSLYERRTASRHAHGYRQHLARMQRVCTDYTPRNQALCEQARQGIMQGQETRQTPLLSLLPQHSNSKNKHQKHQNRSSRLPRSAPVQLTYLQRVFSLPVPPFSP